MGDLIPMFLNKVPGSLHPLLGLGSYSIDIWGAGGSDRNKERNTFTALNLHRQEGSILTVDVDFRPYWAVVDDNLSPPVGNVRHPCNLDEVARLINNGGSRGLEYRQKCLVWEVVDRSHLLLFTVNPLMAISRGVLGGEPCRGYAFTGYSLGFTARCPDM